MTIPQERSLVHVLSSSTYWHTARCNHILGEGLFKGAQTRCCRTARPLYDTFYWWTGSPCGTRSPTQTPSICLTPLPPRMWASAFPHNQTLTHVCVRPGARFVWLSHGDFQKYACSESHVPSSALLGLITPLLIRPSPGTTWDAGGFQSETSCQTCMRFMDNV